MTDDLISRQAVIDYICHYDCGCSHNECEGEDCDFIDAIMTMPSYVPDINVGEIVESEDKE